jgi:hypothetical protein
LFVEEGTTNLVKNPSFETDSDGNGRADNWDVHTGTPACSLDAARAVFGNWAQKMVTDGTEAIRQDVTVEAGQTYTISLYMMEESGQTGRVLLRDGSGNTLSQEDPAFATMTRYTKTLTMPAGETTLRIILLGFTGGTYYFDGVQVEKKPYATTFTDGTRSPELLTIPTAGVVSFDEGTIELRFKPSQGFFQDGLSYQRIIGHASGVNLDEIELMRSSTTSRVSFAISNHEGQVGGWNNLVSTTNLVVDTWYHIAVRWSFADETYAIFVNGVKESEKALSETYKPSVAGVTAIGYHPNIAGRHCNSAISDLRISSRARTDEEILAAYQSGEPLPVGEHTTYKMAGGPWESVGAVFPCSARRSMQIRLTLARTGFGDQYLSGLSIFEALILQMLEEPKPQIRPPDVTHVICYVEDSEPLIEVTASLPGIAADKRIEVRISVPAGSSQSYAQSYANAYLAVHGVEKRSLTCRIPICTRIGFAELVAVAYKPWGRGLDNPWLAMVQEITHYPLAEIPVTELVVGDYQPDDTEALVQLIVRGG